MRSIATRLMILLALALTPACAAAAPPVQTPPPAPTPRPPYRIGAVTIVNGDVSLGGTLTVPEGPGLFPGVVLIPGDVALNSHIADELTRKGVVVFRYDTADGGDALAAVAHLKGMTTIDARRIGVLGHGQGAAAAMAAGAASPDLAFIVTLGGPVAATGPAKIAIPVFANPGVPDARLLSDVAAWIFATPRRSSKW